MNVALYRAADELDLEHDARFRLAFGIACVGRIRHLLTDELAVAALGAGRAFLAGECTEAELEAAAVRAERLATSHPGAASIDGSGHAAVSATHALARALSGRALDAADYAAYASVYAYAAHAVSNPEAYAEEHAWQEAALRDLAARRKGQEKLQRGRSL